MSKRHLPFADVAARPGVQSDIKPRVMDRWNPDMRATGEGDNAISILDPIGNDYWDDSVSAERIAAALRQIGEGDVVVNINSPGGDFFEGLAIYNLLVEHPGAVTVKVLGLAASAASVIAMAGDEVQIGQGAFLMIHNTWVMAAGDRHAMREVADWLEPFDTAAAGIYAARTGLDAAEIGTLLDRETWIGGQAAVDQGFADTLLGADEVAGAVSSDAELTPLAARKKIDISLARAGVTKSERRRLVAAMKGGTSSAAPSGMSSAAVISFAQDALAKLETF